MKIAKNKMLELVKISLLVMDTTIYAVYEGLHMSYTD